MNIFELMKNNNQEQIAFYADTSVKLRAILAIHSTALGPAIGGIRIFPYQSEKEALFDLLRLSRAMTFKTAAGGVNFGGGHIVVVDQTGMVRNEPLFRSLGRFIESLNGRFIAGEDIGVTEESMEYMAMETKNITGLPAYYGGSGSHTYMCACGVHKGMLAAAKYKWGSDNISGRKIVIQGYGRTGIHLAALLKKDGANVIIADINPAKVEEAQEAGFKTIAAGHIYSEPCDILAPCAVGAVITPETSEKFQCQIIAGSANNQLLNDDDDLLLKKRGILYAPDFIINAGGIIDVSEEYMGYHDSEHVGYKKEKVERKIENIYDRMLEILETADENNISVNQAAIRFALKRIDSIKHIKGTFF